MQFLGENELVEIDNIFKFLQLWLRIFGLSLSEEEGRVEDAEWLLACGRSVVDVGGATADAAANDANAACCDAPGLEGPPKGDHKCAAAAGQGKA